MVALVVAAPTALTAQSPQTAISSRRTSSYTPPRMPWGDPDLQGVWRGTEMVGVPLQRPQQFGTRHVLTDEEFQHRVRQARQTDENALRDRRLHRRHQHAGRSGRQRRRRHIGWSAGSRRARRR
jgi:hypothetical protein